MAKRLPTLASRVPKLPMGIAPPAKKAPEPFYLSAAWKTLRHDLIKARGRRCEGCGKTREDDGSPVRLIADHIVERRDGGADLDPRNIQLLCCRDGGNGAVGDGGRRGGCHARKTAEAKAARLRR